MKFKRLFMVLLLSALLIMGLAVSAAANPEFRLRAGIGLNDQSAQFASMQYFADLVYENSGGRIQIDLYHSSQLGDDREMTEALQMGVQDFTCPSTAPLAGFVSGFKVFDLPFLFPTEEAADYVLDSEIGDALLAELEGIGLVGLAWWENGFRHLTNRVRPVETPADMAGLRVRTMENPIHLAAFRAMGANPTPMAFGELFSAMQQGVVDGQENPFGTIYLQNYPEVQDYVSDTGHIYSPFVLLLSQMTWNRLPADLQEVLVDAAEQAKWHNRDLNREWNAMYAEELDKVMNLSRLTMEQKAAFQEATMPVWEQYADEIGQDLIDAVLVKLDEWAAQQ